jgi:hypothetical protein
MAEVNQQQVIEYIKGISVMELSQLVKALETELGVSAAAAMPMMGMPMGGGAAGGGAAAPAEEQTEFTATLTDVVLLARNGCSLASRLRGGVEAPGLPLRYHPGCFGDPFAHRLLTLSLTAIRPFEAAGVILHRPTVTASASTAPNSLLVFPSPSGFLNPFGS